MQISCGNLGRKLQRMPRRSAGRTVAFRIEQFGETRVFLQKGEVLIVASVITIFGTQLDGYFQILHGGFGFAGKAIECGHGVHNMVGLGRGLAGAIEMFASFVPATEVHERDALGVVVFGGLRSGDRGAGDALIANADMHFGAVVEFLGGTMQDLFEGLLGARELLLLEKLESFLVGLELGLLGRRVRIGRRSLKLRSGLSQLSFQWFMALCGSVFSAGPGAFQLVSSQET
jgi:hypothetical protein